MPEQEKKTKLAIGIAGCTGAVGVEILKCMSECDLSVDADALVLFASERSAGKLQSTPWGEKAIRAFSVEEARKLDVVFLAVSGDFAKAVRGFLFLLVGTPSAPPRLTLVYRAQNAPALAAPGGPIVIDNSSAFRYDPQYPLVVPEASAPILTVSFFRERGKECPASEETSEIQLLALAR